MKRRLSRQSSTASAPVADKDARECLATVESMGRQGHGAARIDGARVHIPFALPGEIARIRLGGAKAEIVAIESASPERVEPVCKHFGACGGCSLQHWAEAPYAQWKTDLVRSALAREGLDAAFEPLRSYPLASRRRAVFTARKGGGHFRLGYQVERSHHLIDIEECPILSPQVFAALPVLRETLAGALSREDEAKVHIAAAENGLDCSIESAKAKAMASPALAQRLSAAPILRITWNGEIAFLKAVPFVVSGGVKVALPQGAFLQAVEACERDMAGFVAEALEEAKATRGPLCDLFAGLGAFTFPCARFAPVTAYEENAAAVAALGEAAKGAASIKPVKAVRRDLFRNPLGPLELNGFAAAVLDPPREGAEAQARALAASKIGAAVMLSCNPVTFARDAGILAEGGFRLTRLAVFDQFHFSAHLEIAASFLRADSKKGRRAPALRI